MDLREIIYLYRFSVERDSCTNARITLHESEAFRYALESACSARCGLLIILSIRAGFSTGNRPQTIPTKAKRQPHSANARAAS